MRTLKPGLFYVLRIFFFSQSDVFLELDSLAAKFSCPGLIQPVVKLYLSADDLACTPHLYLNLL